MPVAAGASETGARIVPSPRLRAVSERRWGWTDLRTVAVTDSAAHMDGSPRAIGSLQLARMFELGPHERRREARSVRRLP